MGCVTVKDPKTHKIKSQPNLIFFQVLLALILAALPPTAQGEPPPISTDRILQTNSPDILQPGYHQLETGFYSYETDRENNIKSKHTLLNNNLYRIGFREKMELRLALYGYNIQHAASGDDTGLSDAEISTKILLFDSSANRPKTTLNAGFTVPIGNDAFTSDKVDPFFSFIPSFSNLLPDSIYNDNSLGVSWNDSNADFKYATLWGHNLSESVIFYAEFFGAMAIDSGSNSYGFDWGLTWAIKNNVQLDFFAGNSLNDSATDFFINLGLSIRFPE